MESLPAKDSGALNLQMIYDEQQGAFSNADHNPDSIAHGLQMIQTCQFRFQSMIDIQHINALLSLYFHDNKNALIGINALMMNAVEHGIYKIGYELKAELIATNQWAQEMGKRSQDPQFQDLHAEIILTHKDDGVYVVISDPGDGFDWKKYMAIDPIRAGRKHGRGIALANALSFDKLSYNDKGNQAVAHVSHEAKIEW